MVELKTGSEEVVVVGNVWMLLYNFSGYWRGLQMIQWDASSVGIYFAVSNYTFLAELQEACQHSHTMSTPSSLSLMCWREQKIPLFLLPIPGGPPGTFSPLAVLKGGKPKERSCIILTMTSHLSNRMIAQHSFTAGKHTSSLIPLVSPSMVTVLFFSLLTNVYHDYSLFTLPSHMPLQ